MNKRAIIFGGSSLIGRTLRTRLGRDCILSTFYKTPIPDGVFFDALNPDFSTFSEMVLSANFGLLLFADSRIDSCARNPSVSNQINVCATCETIEWMFENQIVPIFLSSDMVFGGEQGNYDETSLPDPILTYGRQKLAVENYLAKSGRKHLIVRLSKVLSQSCDERTELWHWQKALDSSKLIRCADDQLFSAIELEDVAAGICGLMQQNCSGLYHLGGAESWSRWTLLQEYLISAEKLGVRFDHNIEVCSIRDFAEFAECRPINTTMNSTKIARNTGFYPRDIRSSIRRFVFNAYSK